MAALLACIAITSVFQAKADLFQFDMHGTITGNKGNVLDGLLLAPDTTLHVSYSLDTDTALVLDQYVYSAIVRTYERGAATFTLENMFGSRSYSRNPVIEVADDVPQSGLVDSLILHTEGLPPFFSLGYISDGTYINGVGYSDLVLGINNMVGNGSMTVQLEEDLGGNPPFDTFTIDSASASLTPVPEPSAFALLALSGGVLALCRRRAFAK